MSEVSVYLFKPHRISPGGRMTPKKSLLFPAESTLKRPVFSDLLRRRSATCQYTLSDHLLTCAIDFYHHVDTQLTNNIRQLWGFFLSNLPALELQTHLFGSYINALEKASHSPVPNAGLKQIPRRRIYGGLLQTFRSERGRLLCEGEQLLRLVNTTSCCPVWYNRSVVYLFLAFKQCSCYDENLPTFAVSTLASA